MALSAYTLLVVLALILTLVHALVAPPRVPLWIPVLLITIALLINATLH